MGPQKMAAQRLNREQLMRPVETHGVVAQALDSLVKEAAPAGTAEASAA